MLKFRTKIDIPSPDFQINYQYPILSVGSCFADEIGQRLQNMHYQVALNPFGVLYNPISIRNSVALLLNEYKFVEEDLFFHNGLWHSFQHHSSFSRVDKEACLLYINTALSNARKSLEETKVLILTFGTAWIYELEETGKVVSNCHKLPANNFERKRLTVDDILDSFGGLLEYLKIRLPDLQIIMTVSPVRHLKDGFAGNQMSKATLLLAVQELSEQLDYVHYFPAYEIMMDDLRDYRFYKEDLVHPNKMAVDYIWEEFSANFLSEKEEELRKKIAQLQRALAHRPFNPASTEHQKFVQKQLSTIKQLQKQAPYLDLDKTAIHFQAQLIDL